VWRYEGPLPSRWQGETPEREGSGSCWWWCESCARPAVLSRGVETRETQLDAVSEEERAGGVVVELAAIVALQGTDRAPELQPKGESPKEMGVVIQNDQVVLVARETKDRRCPEITVDKIKGLNSPGRGSGKRKRGVTAELTGMTEALRRAPSI
jgi:hypothetical protein